MRVSVEAVLARDRRERVELDIDTASLVKELEGRACKQLGLIAAEHELRLVLYVPLLGSWVKAYDPKTGKFKDTGELGRLKVLPKLDEGRRFSELGIPSSTPTLLVWKFDHIRQCPVCGLVMTPYCVEYHGFSHFFTEALPCANCKHAYRVRIGEENDFQRESIDSIISMSETILITEDGQGKVSIYEPYGKPWARLTGARVRSHRRYSLLSPDMRRLQAGFRDRIGEVLVSRDISYGLLERVLALQILQLPLTNSLGFLETLRAELSKQYAILEGPLNSSEMPLRRVSKALAGLKALDGSVDGCERDGLREALLQLRNPDGGWTRNVQLVPDKDGEIEKLPGWRLRPEMQTESDVELTYCALQALDCLGVQPEETHRTTDFLQSRQLLDGGFNSRRSSVSESCLFSTFYAVEALNLLGERPTNAEQCISWLQAHQERAVFHLPIGQDGGFALGEPQKGWSQLTRAKRFTKMEPASPWCTYQGVKALSTLGAKPMYPEACIRYVLRQHTMFGFGNGDPSDTYYALSVLKMLGRLEEISSLH
jgi:hypothetical protein